MMTHHPMMIVKGVAMLSASLGVGYLVWVKAKEEEGLTQKLGYLIGLIIIISTLAVAARGICKKVCYATGMKCAQMQSCPMPSGMKTVR